MIYYLGLDMGSSAVKYALLDGDNQLLSTQTHPHHGKPTEVALTLLEALTQRYPQGDIQVSMTGSNAPSSGKLGDIPCIEQGLSILEPHAKSAIDIGGENARFLTNLGRGTPPKFSVNEHCAGGTGSFFEDQMYRLGIPMEDYSKLVAEATAIPRLSGRCSVFAKTDIIHRQQEGTSIPDILLGLCYATVGNFKATTVKNLPVERPLALCGGVLRNTGVVQAVKALFALEDSDLLCHEELVYVQGVGAAKLAQEQGMSLAQCIDQLRTQQGDALAHHQPLSSGVSNRYGDPSLPILTEHTPCALGIDVGSTSTNLVLVDSEGQLVDFQYLRTKGDPQGAVRQGLQSIAQRLGHMVAVTSVGVTGSGRYLIGEMVGGDIVKDEITAQAKGASFVCPTVDTVFEIGGQDSKYIHLSHGQVGDFQMNKICAAGTGSFVEEQASRLGVALADYGQIALTSTAPIDLGERCTVFMESNINSAVAKGAKLPDILAGICHSVVKNYAIKVVGQKPVGKEIMLQGGVCYNPAIVAAFRSIYGEGVMVSPYFSVSGAFGVALLAHQSMAPEGQSNFRGWALDANREDNSHTAQQTIAKNISFYEKAKECLMDGYTRTLNPKKQTIGVPYVLVVHKFFPMIRNYFETLGYNVLLSPETDEEIIALSQQYAQVETCYPVKLIYGHMAWLAQRKVDYLFMPSVLTMKHEKSKVYHNYGCVYMQSAPKLIFDNLKLSEQGIKLLNPVFSLDFGQEAMAGAMVGVGVSLGKPKPVCAAALMMGAKAVRKHTMQVEKMGEELLKTLNPTDKVLVLITRTYGLEDPVLNMGIPQALLQRGHKVITLAHLPGHDLDLSEEYPNLYWPFGQHIIGGAKLVANHPNLYAIYLTNHGCGPDGMMSHLFHQEMGDKPYLSIEVDEHFSNVGVVTRIEAFLNALETQPNKTVTNGADYFNNLPVKKPHLPSALDKAIPVALPHLYPYTTLLQKVLVAEGYQVSLRPPVTEETLALGGRITTGKEYLSFTALAGDMLALCGEVKEPVQLLMPQTEGSEADGLYPRVLANYLPEDGAVTLVSPTLETLPFVSSLCPQIFLALLAGDVVLSAPRGQRGEVLQTLLQSPLSLEEILAVAQSLPQEEKKKIALIGDPAILYHSTLNHGLLKDMEKQGYGVQWMPLSEYFASMWQKRGESDAQKAVVSQFAKQMGAVATALGTNSPFAPNLQALAEVNQKNRFQLAGGNGSYRFAKRHTLTGCQGVIEVSATYENTQTILGLTQEQPPLPVLSLTFDDGDHQGTAQQLASFLHYMNR